MKKVFSLFIFLIFSQIVRAESTFEKLDFFGDVSIEVPKHWHKNDVDTIQNVKASAQALLESAGQNGNMNKTVLSVNSRPMPMKAIIRLSLQNSQDFSEADLASVTLQDLIEVNRDIKPTMEKEYRAMMGKSLPIKIIAFNDLDIVKVHQHYAFVISYIRTNAQNSDEHWLVRIFHFPYKTGTLQLTLSYDLAQEKLYRPILDKVLNSFTY